MICSVKTCTATGLLSGISQYLERHALERHPMDQGLEKWDRFEQSKAEMFEATAQKGRK